MKPIQDLFPELLRKRPQRELPLEDLVRAAWGQIVGRQLAARSEVFRVYQDTLIVHVPDDTWKRQLLRLERKLLSRVADLLGRTGLARMEFRVAPAGAAGLPPRKEPGRVAPAPAAGAADPELEESARAIADPRLRELFLRASKRMIK